MKLRLFPLPLAFCLLPLPVFASAVADQGGQSGTTLSGTVTQTGNGQPLAGALVVVDELRKEVRTGDDGRYHHQDIDDRHNCQVPHSHPLRGNQVQQEWREEH